ncbi:MAG: HEAT repeat domain-containing protein [Phycisphaerae bacterium]
MAELLTLCESEQPAAVRREVLWMLSEIAGDEAVGAIAPLFANADLREDARMSLERLPGEKSLAALKEALKSAPEDFRPNIAVSLRQRGVQVADYPSAKLVPTKATQVKPARG